MKHIRVNVEGNGTFDINIEFVPELLRWLSSKQAVSVNENNTVREIKNNQFTGRQLIQG